MNIFISMIGIHIGINSAEMANLALHKPTLSSSVYFELSDPANSVDGNRESDWARGSCFASESGDSSPWLLVDLQGFYKITRVLLVNRGECCPDRLNDFTVETFLHNPVDSPAAIASRCFFYSGHPGLGEIVLLDCDMAVTGRYVRVRNSVEVMQVCEIEVYGDQAVPQCSAFYCTLNGRMQASLGLSVQNPVLCAELCANSSTCLAFNFRWSVPPECEFVSGNFAASDQTDGWRFYERTLC